MKKKILLISLAVVLALSVDLIGCAGEEEEEEEAPAYILIGDTVSYTGPYAVFGGVASWGTEAAVKDINAEGGIYVEEYGKKIPVKWITVDCESDPTKVATLTENLILNVEVHFLGGHFEVPTMRQGTAQMAQEYGIPAVFGVGTYELWREMQAAATEPWTYSWAFGFSRDTPALEGDYREGDPGYLMFPTWLGALETFAADTNKKVALFALDDPDGLGWYQGFAVAAGDAGYDCYRAEEEFGVYAMGTTDFTSLIQEWKDAGCEILCGNTIATDIGAVLLQCQTRGFDPKVVFATRGAMFCEEVTAWGSDLPEGVITEIYWSPAIQNAEGIGGETPQGLAERWHEDNGEQAVPQGIGWNYAVAQTLFDAIYRAGTLDADAVCEALAETDLVSMWSRVVFEQTTQFQRVPCQIGQWRETANPWVWEAPTVFSYNDFLPAETDLIFPKPWD